MVTTRGQTAASEGKPASTTKQAKPASSKKKASPTRKRRTKKAVEQAKEEEKPELGSKRDVEEVEKEPEVAGGEKEVEEPPTKKAKAEVEPQEAAETGKETAAGEAAAKEEAAATRETVTEEEEAAKEEATAKEVAAKEEEVPKEEVAAKEEDHPAKHAFQEGVIERGHIYFFYRPKVELEEAHSIDDVQRFNILLVPRPPEFAIEPVTTETTNVEEEEGPMKILQPGADVVPAAQPTDVKKKPFRLITVGKKSLPDPEIGGGKGGGRKQVFWATITTVGDDLEELEEGLGEREYETKTRGQRYQGPARLAGRGAYAIVNTQARTQSTRETHLGYHLSHPDPEHFGEVQRVLGIHEASSFVVQVKNPLAPTIGAIRAGLPSYRKVEFPDNIMKEVFGYNKEAEHTRGREDYGLRFTSVERREMLDYEGVELLFIAAREGEEGLESSLGEGRGEALTETELKEAQEDVETVLKELAIDAEKIPAEPLKGEWI
ncbi:unnamed protein product [Somion occarium]|uniref:Uncharacterized protein n=1 Tax=Somion occarium TaxID=3059160 RepID=A0ABP1CHQ4_9APHY